MVEEGVCRTLDDNRPHRVVRVACHPDRWLFVGPGGDGPDCDLCWQGVGALSRPDQWWRDLWAWLGTIREVSDHLDLHTDDVRVRLRRAGVELRGRPPRQRRWLW